MTDSDGAPYDGFVSDPSETSGGPELRYGFPYMETDLTWITGDEPLPAQAMWQQHDDGVEVSVWSLGKPVSERYVKLKFTNQDNLLLVNCRYEYREDFMALVGLADEAFEHPEVTPFVLAGSEQAMERQWRKDWPFLTDRQIAWAKRYGKLLGFLHSVRVGKVTSLGLLRPTLQVNVGPHEWHVWFDSDHRPRFCYTRHGR